MAIYKKARGGATNVIDETTSPTAPERITRVAASTGGTETVLALRRGTTGTAVDGIGGGFLFELESEPDVYVSAFELRPKWESGAGGTERARTHLACTTGGALPADGAEQFSFSGDGYFRALTGGVIVRDGANNDPTFAFTGDPYVGLSLAAAGSLGMNIGNGIYGATLSAPADGETAMSLRRNVGGAFTNPRVTMGAADSAGVGFKVLRVPNT